jgi:hypothetical protein
MSKKAIMSNSKSCDHGKKDCVCGGHSNKAKKSRKKNQHNNYIDTIQL